VNLRSYQEQCVSSALAGFNEYQRQLIVIPTGGGKTIVFSKLAEAVQPKRTLILAHREELIDQAVDKIAKATGIFAQVEKAEQRASLMAPVVVASVQTLAGQQRRERWPQDHFHLVVIDEAHHALADSYQRVLGHFDAKVLGVTATPDRGDKRNLGQYFENVAYEITMFDLIKQGYLSPVKVKALPVEIDLSNVKSVAGDYSADDLGTALTPYLRSIAKALREHASFRKCLVFLPLIATSKAFTEICIQEGLSAAHVDGMSEDRKNILARFADGEFEVLSNAMLLTEGFDDPSIDCVVVLRPTRSRALYAQMIGRGTRVCQTKDDLLVLDFLWLHEKHNLVRPAHLVAGTNEIADAITEKLEHEARGGGQGELDLESLNASAVAEREDRLQEELRKQANRKAKTIDAMELSLSLHNIEAAEYEPSFNWERGPVSPGQRAVLEKFGIGMDTVRCKGHASKILDMLFSRSKLGLATPRQLKYLRQLGHPSPETATFKEASAYLDARWKEKSKKLALG
jgi:superfamily II DNA or RNA helicase